MFRVLNSMWFTLAVLALLIVLSVGLFRRLPPLSSARQEARRAEEKLAILQREREEQRQKQQYSTSQAYIERQARLQLGFQKPGEHVVYVYRSAGSAPSPSPTPALSHIELWWYYLIGK